LPGLDFEGRPYLSQSEFLCEARKWLCAKDYRILSKSKLGDCTFESTSVCILKDFAAFEIKLRSEVAKFRAARREGREYGVSIVPVSWVRELTYQPTA
jgi:hypothetical protein